MKGIFPTIRADEIAAEFLRESGYSTSARSYSRATIVAAIDFVLSSRNDMKWHDPFSPEQIAEAVSP